MPNKNVFLGKKIGFVAEISSLDFRHVIFRVFSISYEGYFNRKDIIKAPIATLLSHILVAAGLKLST